MRMYENYCLIRGGQGLLLHWKACKTTPEELQLPLHLWNAQEVWLYVLLFKASGCGFFRWQTINPAGYRIPLRTFSSCTSIRINSVRALHYLLKGTISCSQFKSHVRKTVQLMKFRKWKPQDFPFYLFEEHLYEHPPSICDATSRY